MSVQHNTRTKVPLIFCIDLEPDTRAIDPHNRKDWLGFEAGWEPLQDWRGKLTKATGSQAHFSWYVRIDPQVELTYGVADWAVTRYQSCFSLMQQAEDEIGVHPHSWRWLTAEAQWVSDFGDQAWVEHCVRQSLRCFEQQFGKPCRSFRFGDRWLNNETVALLETLGVEFDLTIEPGRKQEALSELFTGAIPDYRPAPRIPYRPAPADFLRCETGAAARNLWMIPISTASLHWACPMLSPEARQQLKTPFWTSYQGWLDEVNEVWLQGWVYDARRPDETIYVDLWDGDELLATYAADLLREDLFRAGKGSGAHGFMIPVPEQKRDGRPHQMHVRVAGTSHELRRSPYNAIWSADDPGEDYLTINLASNHSLFRRFCEALLQEPQAPILNFIMRTDVFLHETLWATFERNLNYLRTHPRVSDFVIATPAEALAIWQRQTVGDTQT